MKKIIYIDMDGTLAKWDSNATTEDTKKKGFFLSRKPQSNLIAAVKKLMKNKEIECCVLSAVYGNAAADEKRKWLEKYLPGISSVFVPYGQNKADYIPSEQPSVLLDDYSVNLHNWISVPGNIGIKFRNGINGTNGTWRGKSIDHTMSIKEMEIKIREACE